MTAQVLITGASRGVGRAIAEHFAQRGMRLALVGRDAHALHQVATACQKAGAQATPLVCDLSDMTALPKLVEQATRALGGLSVLVNNAGQLDYAPVEKANLVTWDRILQINTQAVIHLTHHALPSLLKAPQAAVINIASVSSKQSHGGGGIYCASKHALLGFSNALFEDVRAQNMKVCAICPGYVDTDMIAGAPIDHSKAIRPADIAQAAAYVLDCSTNVCPTEIVLRPQQPM